MALGGMGFGCCCKTPCTCAQCPDNEACCKFIIDATFSVCTDLSGLFLTGLNDESGTECEWSVLVGDISYEFRIAHTISTTQAQLVIIDTTGPTTLCHLRKVVTTCKWTEGSPLTLTEADAISPFGNCDFFNATFNPGGVGTAVVNIYCDPDSEP
jgi:hypothetical protein